MLTGNLLQNKVDKANELLEALPTPGNPSSETKDEQVDVEFDGNVYSNLVVSASGLDLKKYTSDDNRILRVNTIAENYDTVSVTLSDENGIVYTSPALMDVLRLPAASEDGSYQALVSLCTAAKAKNLRISGVLSSSLPVMEAETAALVDATLAKELYSLGFDEVLFTDTMPEETDKVQIQIAKEYLETIRESVGDGFTLGIVLPISVYKDVTYTQQVQMIASVVDFMAVDFTSVTISNNDPDMTLEKICLSLQGMFKVYNLRIVLANPNISQLAEQYNLLTSMEMTNIQFLGEITPSLLADAFIDSSVESTEDTSAEIDTSEDPLPQRNPYATSGSNQSGTDDATSEKETYYQSGESGSSWY